MPETTLSDGMLRAYRETLFYVEDTKTVTLNIDKPSEGIGTLHKRYGVSSSAFITAYNPHSEQLVENDNRQRQRTLLGEVAKRHWHSIKGIGQHPSNEWPGEPSILILGITLLEAKSLGRHFRQNALVFISDDNTPRLVLLR